MCLSSKEAHHKAVNTCTTHICVMLISYTPSLFYFLTHCFGRGIPPHVHIILGSLYFLIPPMLNPIIYEVKTKEFRDKVTKYGCWKREPTTTVHGQKLVCAELVAEVLHPTELGKPHGKQQWLNKKYCQRDYEMVCNNCLM
ncbi:hypothetical protein H8959_002477 [Pygathrix nigripes]